MTLYSGLGATKKSSDPHYGRRGVSFMHKLYNYKKLMDSPIKANHFFSKRSYSKIHIFYIFTIEVVNTQGAVCEKETV